MTHAGLVHCPDCRRPCNTKHIHPIWLNYRDARALAARNAEEEDDEAVDPWAAPPSSSRAGTPDPEVKDEDDEETQSKAGYMGRRPYPPELHLLARGAIDAVLRLEKDRDYASAVAAGEEIWCVVNNMQACAEDYIQVRRETLYIETCS